MRRSPRFVGALLLVALVTAACGADDGGDSRASDRRRSPATSTPSPTGAETPVRACDLLAEADVQAAFGEAVVAGIQTADECWWSTANDLKVVNLIRRTGDVATWRDGYDNDFWVPNDFGDEGYSGTALDSVVWRLGDTQYEVNVVFSTRGDPDRVVQELAEKAAGRL